MFKPDTGHVEPAGQALILMHVNMLIYVNVNVVLQRCGEEVFFIMRQLLMSVDTVGACCRSTLTVMTPCDSAVAVTYWLCAFIICVHL